MAEGSALVKRLWAAQERRFALWSPVAIGLGIALRFEGAGMEAALAALGAGLGGWLLWRRKGWPLVRPVAVAAMLVLLGMAAAGMRIAAVEAPVLEEGFRGVVGGRVVAADRSRSDAPRVVLDRVTLRGVRREAVPAQVRISLVDLRRAPAIGATISVEAVLGPPSGPASPGGFDFSRRAFFRGIGAVGYARGAVTVTAPPQGRALWLARQRARIAEALRDRIGGDRGAVAAALIVGDRSGISEPTVEALRDSGLAHLLAISGLHIGLMSALSFWLVRFALALLPGFASRVPIRKIAALAGLGSAAGYLALAGFGVATQRAFVMAAVAFLAILIDRPAVTMRGLAAAACIVLVVRPESLLEAGFQMSFAAVAALVAGYEVAKPFWRARAADRSWRDRALDGLLATLFTSAIAGLATAPFAAYHFNRLVAFGLVANVLATPLMGLWIMPAIILSAVLAPVGLAGIGLAPLSVGIGYILGVAETVAALDGSALSIASGSPPALALLVFGGLWLVIWRGGARLFGLAPMAMGLWLWAAVERPDLLIARDGALVGGRTAQGALWVSRERSLSYGAETWLRRDGAGTVDQKDAYARRRWRCNRRTCEGLTSGDVPVILFRGSATGLLAERACADGAILIAPKVFADPPSGNCTILDRSILDDASSVALYLRGEQPPRIEVARAAFSRPDQ